MHVTYGDSSSYGSQVMANVKVLDMKFKGHSQSK